MANLQESNIWESSIYQLETTDPVVGGVDGISNKQAKQLANRTSYLKAQIEDIKSNTSNFETTAHADKTYLTKSDFNKFIPAGIIIAHTTKSSLDGYLFCDGSAVSRTAYSALFEAIGTTYGTGDGSTTFNIPDFRGCFLRMAGGNSGPIGTKQGDAIRNITGRIPGIATWNDTWQSEGAFRWNIQRNIVQPFGSNQGYDELSFDVSRVVPTANENRPLNFAVNYFIKY